MGPSDAELLDDVRKGDRAAIEALLSRYEASIYRFGLRMCGNEEAAREVLQETLLAAFRDLPTFRGDAAISTWLYQIARSFCIKERRGEHPTEPLEGRATHFSGGHVQTSEVLVMWQGDVCWLWHARRSGAGRRADVAALPLPRA
jgi:RNA polymerase sigma-70 factor (ECF subfamily)